MACAVRTCSDFCQCSLVVAEQFALSHCCQQIRVHFHQYLRQVQNRRQNASSLVLKQQNYVKVCIKTVKLPPPITSSEHSEPPETEKRRSFDSSQSNSSSLSESPRKKRFSVLLDLNSR